MEPKYYRIKNWEIYQHYKDRNPPWIKLHYEMLSSEDWVMANDETRVLMIAIMLIGSKNNGYFLNNQNFIKRVAYLDKINLEPLISSGFLEPASELEQPLAQFRPEKEKEKEKELFIKFWSEYPRKVGKSVAKTAWFKVIRRYPAEDIVAASEEYARQCTAKRTEEQYILHPSTFLNKERWKDYCLEA